MSQISINLKLCFLKMTMSLLYSNRSQSSGAPSGCGGTGNWHHACTMCRYHVKVNQCFQQLSESMPQDIEGKIQEELPSADDNTFNVFLPAHYLFLKLNDRLEISALV